MEKNTEIFEINMEEFLRQFKHTLMEPKKLIRLLEKSKVTTPDLSLATGLSGVLMLSAQLQEQEKQWEEVGANMLQYINTNLQPMHLSLWAGLTGIAASTYLLSNNGKYYSNFLHQINELIVNSTEDFLNQAKKNIQSGNVQSFDFETIYGLAGIGRYLLFFSKEEEVNQLINKMIDYFVLLDNQQEVNGFLLPHYFITFDNQFEDDRNRYQNGHLDLGISHGICGPLAFLSLAYEQGFNYPKQVEVIHHLSSILIDFAQEDGEMVWWPSKISFEEFTNKKLQSYNKYSFAWCYGAPGVARTLWLSGRVTNNQLYKELAKHAYSSLSKLNLNQLGLVSPTYCHGYAGLLHQTLLMYLETRDENLYYFMETIKDELLTFFNKNNPLGFYDIDYNGNKKTCVGGLEGISGIWSTIDAVDKLKKPNWSFLFLLD
ncbi:lanthionine synthetase C family protein [Oceanobacillus alkalisoli]|uniref:lanthionine synthetase C family protein n=1 Tax=Oceanobacillus alkalisoli TaxID=2925113 RepID=UPI001EE49A75|nr:lanthionine synthetase C family protein [Oceanobacillus alkalisoli]MCG5103140.1 lanthionine synthetase C family protein [Oceanobacillus alkalisoli]